MRLPEPLPKLIHFYQKEAQFITHGFPGISGRIVSIAMDGHVEHNLPFYHENGNTTRYGEFRVCVDPSSRTSAIQRPNCGMEIGQVTYTTRN